MKEPVVIIGTGEMAGVFARGFLKRGHPLFPVTRQTPAAETAQRVPHPVCALVSVGEHDLPTVLCTLPESWRDRLVLLQNELLPRDWQAHGIVDPTVIAVWFEKKKGQDYKVLVPSPIFGPNAGLLVEALTRLDIAAIALRNSAELLFELVRKNVYILTTNIAGLVVGGTAGELWERHRELALAIAHEVMDIQEALTGAVVDRAALIAGVAEAIEGDPHHTCMGRSAPARLSRALAHADAAALAVPQLRAIAGGGSWAAS